MARQQQRWGLGLRRFHLRGDEPRERAGVPVDAGAVQGVEVSRAIGDLDDGPGIATGRQEQVHQEAGNAAIAVGVGMYVSEQPVPQDGPHSWLWLALEQIEQRR